MGAAGTGFDGRCDVGAEDMLMSNRSPIPLPETVEGVLIVDWAGIGAAKPPAKSPKSLPKLSFRAAGIVCEAVCAGLGGGAGLLSKKLPPLSADLFSDGCLAWPVGGVNPAKGADLTGCACGGEEKDSEPKASPIPPSACALDCDCIGDVVVGDCIPPNALMLEAAACCGGGAAGLEA